MHLGLLVPPVKGQSRHPNNCHSTKTQPQLQHCLQLGTERLHSPYTCVERPDALKCQAQRTWHCIVTAAEGWASYVAFKCQSSCIRWWCNNPSHHRHAHCGCFKVHPSPSDCLCCPFVCPPERVCHNRSTTKDIGGQQASLGACPVLVVKGTSQAR